MENRERVWGFSENTAEIFAVNCRYGIEAVRIPVALPFTKIVDFVVNGCKAYLLQFSYLISVDVNKFTAKRHELPVGSYKSLVAYKDFVYILGDCSFKFAVGSKLCRKVAVSVKDLSVICKSFYRESIYILANTFEKGGNTKLIEYSIKNNLMNVIELKFRLKLCGSSGCFVRENAIFVFGGQYLHGWSSQELFSIDLENLECHDLQQMVRVAHFTATSIICDLKDVSAVDSTGALHKYYFKTGKWRMFSIRHWNKRKHLLWLWRISTLGSGNSRFSLLPEVLIRRILTEFM